MTQDTYQPRREHKFTFGLWTVGNRGREIAKRGIILADERTEIFVYFARHPREEIIAYEKPAVLREVWVEIHEILERAGFRIVWFEERLSGPRMIDPASRPKRRSYDMVPSYLATQDFARAERLL